MLSVQMRRGKGSVALWLGLREAEESRACFGAAQRRLGIDWGRGAVRAAMGDDEYQGK